jgi:hypothetical protein
MTGTFLKGDLQQGLVVKGSSFNEVTPLSWSDPIKWATLCMTGTFLKGDLQQGLVVKGSSFNEVTPWQCIISLFYGDHKVLPALRSYQVDPHKIISQEVCVSGLLIDVYERAQMWKL